MTTAGKWGLTAARFLVPHAPTFIMLGRAAEAAAPAAVRAAITADLTVDGRRFGQITEAVVDLEPHQYPGLGGGTLQVHQRGEDIHTHAHEGDTEHSHRSSGSHGANI